MQTEFKSEPYFYEMIELGETKPNLNANTTFCDTNDVEMAQTSGYIVDTDDDRKLLKFLQNINMESLFPILKANQVTFRSLRYIRQEDLKEAIPPLGLRVEFREKLSLWKKSQLGMDDDTISIPSKVGEWLNKNDINTQPTPTIPMTPQQNCCKCAKVLKKDLKTLLNESTKGKTILESALKNQKLNSEQRNDLVAIIVDDIIANDIVLYTQDFTRLVEEICTVLPCEQNMKDYYYIPRRGKNNASGKLYSKHRNRLIKRRKLLTPGESPSIANSQASDNEVEDIVDDSAAVELKQSLIEDNIKWNDICEMWKKTYHLRQKDIKNMESSEVLKAWPKLSTMGAAELINIDFDLRYPNKGNLLFTKWETFKTIIRKYYDTNIHNEYCKQLLAKITPSTSVDSQDYIFTIMLNAVLPSPARFENQIGKRRKRVTIADSQESLVLRLTTLDNYEQQIQEVTSKYYATSLTIQPIMIVEGLSEMHITGFYVYFNNNLLKFNSFLKCLDTCFKIFQTLSLKYPEPCVQPWLFIQKCLYEISRKNDFKSSIMSTLMHFYDNENI